LLRFDNHRVVEPVETTALPRVLEPVETTALPRVVEPVETTDLQGVCPVNPAGTVTMGAN